MGKRFQDRVTQWGAGRYGTDELYRLLVGIALVLMLLQLFTESLVFGALMWPFLIWAVYRMMSRQLDKRQRENQIYLSLRRRIKKWFRLTGHRLRDIRTKRYRRCPYCRATVRFPIKRGVHIVTCPHCQEKFELNIRF